jgi:hypothetical protein
MMSASMLLTWASKRKLGLLGYLPSLLRASSVGDSVLWLIYLFFGLFDALFLFFSW